MIDKKFARDAYLIIILKKKEISVVQKGSRRSEWLLHRRIGISTEASRFFLQIDHKNTTV